LRSVGNASLHEDRGSLTHIVTHTHTQDFDESQLSGLRQEVVREEAFRKDVGVFKKLLDMEV
jgi:hypothetical protein